MTSWSPVTLFTHLISQGENNMRDNLSLYCQPGSALYTETLVLIDAHDQDTKINALIHSTTDDLVHDRRLLSLQGEHLGVYKLVKLLGTGGMGVVYLGERNDGQLSHKAAIKLLYPSILSLAGKDLLYREAQHLADLSHANIAKVFSVDMSPQGDPFLVMEFIDGAPIDRYSEQNNLTTKQKLTLLIKICEALNYAHQSLILHADLKPSNILVDALGEPKLVDFGIARTITTTGAIDDASQKVGFNMVAGASHGFSSPELHSNQPVDTRSDIYSLGKVIDALCAEDTRLKSVIAQCTAAMPSQRYSNVTQVKDELVRYLTGFAMQAERLSWVTRLIMLTNRHRLSSSIVGLLLIGGVWGQQLIASEQRLKEQAQLEAQTIEHVIETMLINADPINGKTSLQAVLVNAAEQILSNDKLRFEKQNLLIAKIAKALRAHQEFDLSLKLFEHIERNYLEQNRPHDRAYFEALLSKIVTLRKLFKYDETSQAYRDLNDNGLPFFEGDRKALASIYSNQAIHYQSLKQFDRAMPLAQQALALDLVQFGPVHEKIRLRKNSIASLLTYLNEYERAEKYASEALVIAHKLYGESHPKVSISHRTLGKLYLRWDKSSDAVIQFSRSVSIDEGVFGQDHRSLLFGLEMLSFSYLVDGQYQQSNATVMRLESLIAQHKLNYKQLNTMVAFITTALHNVTAQDKIRAKNLIDITDEYKQQQGDKDFRYLLFSSLLKNPVTS